MENELTVGGKHFELMGMQRSGTAVYRGTDCFLRIGETRRIESDRALHLRMEALGFPVARILSAGTLGSQSYFIEQSLGTRSFRSLFQNDCDTHGHVSNENFAQFVLLSERLTKAQYASAEHEWTVREFREGINLPMLLRELPAHATLIEKRFAEIAERLVRLPRALIHGDCNPANMYADGIIDLEDSFYGPFGYDQVSALMTIEWSPVTRDYEFFGQYRFSENQKEKYRARISKSIRGRNVTDPMPYFDDLAFCRAIWLCAGMGAWPKLQQWRFEKLVSGHLHT